MQELGASPELQARARTHPDCAIVGPYTGKSQAFENLLRRNSIGRRFFQTESGRLGMTAVETPVGKPTKPTGQPEVPNFDQALSDSLAQMMLGGFHEFLEQRNPDAARALSQAVRGEMPGQAAPGVRAGDMVVAIVGGFQPYILRPVAPPDETGNASRLYTDSKYRFVSDAYVDGFMEGECLRPSSVVTEAWKTDVQVVDISIV